MSKTTNDFPILFSGAMVQAILNGNKTQTRRVMKPQPSPVEYDAMYMWHPYVWGAIGKNNESLPPCPYGRVGDRLWVKETWAAPKEFDHLAPRDIPQEAPMWYAADSNKPQWAGRLRPSIFMPRWASRITLEITDVRVERVQDISETDAKAEGVQFPKRTVTMWDGMYRTAFAGLWDSINKERGYSWEANPWVWAVSFQRVEGLAQ